MQALFFDREPRLKPDTATPRLEPGEALVQVSYAGICNTDLEILNGYMGFKGIPGHEFVGRVAAPEKSKWYGKRVAGEINCGCGKCERCRSGNQRHCSYRTVLGLKGRDGAFAEYLTLPEDRLHEVPGELSDREAVFTEPLAAACRILEQTGIRGPEPPDRILVIGDGKLGLLTAQVLSLHAQVHLLGHHPDRARKVCGRRIVLLQRPPPGQSFPFVVEASGSPEGLESAMEAIEPQGTVVLKSTYTEKPSFDFSLSVVVPEVTVAGSRCGPFPPALKLLSERKINTEAMIEGEYKLTEWNNAFETARKSGALKVLFALQ